jgi:protein-tyrosine-phosphatase/DNA-binding HxlR family transcriptional regulator
MNIETIADLERRAAVYAALSDPARLRVVDLLGRGDLSSTELQAAIGISSNLLAHHLGVLEERGILVRRRSQGDRRRSYVHLLPEAIPGVTSAVAAPAHRVVFVCTANSARSQLAAAIWRQSSAIPATSAGTHPADRIASGAVKAAQRHHLEFENALPQSIDDVLADTDFVITVCDTAHEELRHADAIHWSVPDPVLVGTAAAFDTAYEDLAHRVNELAPRLTAA